MENGFPLILREFNRSTFSISRHFCACEEVFIFPLVHLTTSTSPAYNTATSYGYAESHSTLTILPIKKGNQVSKESFQTYSHC